MIDYILFYVGETQISERALLRGIQGCALITPKFNYYLHLIVFFFRLKLEVNTYQLVVKFKSLLDTVEKGSRKKT